MAGRRSCPIRAALALLLFAAVQSLPAQDADEEDAPLVSDERTSYVVGFSELSTHELPSEYRYLASTLPLLIVESLDAGSGAPDRNAIGHTFTPGERDGYTQSLIEQEVRLARRALSSAVRQRDAILFNRNATESARTRAEESVSEAREKLDALSSMSPADVDLAPEKPLAYWSGRESGRLLDPVTIDGGFRPDPESLAGLTDDANLDLLIWGTVEEIRGYLKVDFYAYSPYDSALGLPNSGTVAQPSDIGQEAEIMASEIARVVLGRPWGSVLVSAGLSDAAITVNGELIGFREATARFLSPGPATVRVSAAGYRDYVQTIVVPDGAHVVVDVLMQGLPQRTVRLESSPAASNVYVDSVWVGRTPIELPVPDSSQVVRLRHDGYLESRFVLGPDSPENVARVLLPDSLVWGQELDATRTQFYRSMTWFVLSVPVTIALYGAYVGIQSMYPTESVYESLTAEAQATVSQLGKMGNILYFASGGGLLVNVGLLVNAAINLFDYVEAGEGAHNQ